MDVYQRRRLVALSALAAIFIVFVLLIRSCGGDDETTTPTPVAGASGLGGVSEQSKAAFIDQADAICQDDNNSIAGVDMSAPTANSDLSGIIAGELQQLQSLPPPDEDTNDLDDFYSALDELAQAYEDKATALDRGDDAQATEIDAAIDEAQAEATDSAENFGFQICGDPSQVSNTDEDDADTDTDATDTSGGTVTPPATTTPVEPVPTTEVPPVDTGTEPAPPVDDGSDTGSGGVSP